MEVRNKMLEEIGSEQTEENQEDEEALQKMREKKTSKIYPTSIMMNHRNENQKGTERNLSQKLHMFIEKEAATSAVVIQDTKVRQRLDNSHLAQAPEKKHPSLNISLEEKKKGRTKTRTQIDGDRRETERKP